MKKNLSFLCSSLFMAVIALAGFTSCNDDEPVVLSGISINAATFELDLDGNATIEFTVEPADAEVEDVDITLDNLQAITVSGLTRVAKGAWKTNVKIDDIRSFGESRNGTLTVNQTNGGFAQTSFTLVDPFSVPKGTFTAHHPYTVNYCDAASHTPMRLPVILNSESYKEEDIADVRLLVSSTNPKLDGGGNNFVFGRDKNAIDEYGIFMSEETVKKIVSVNPEQYYTVNADIELTMNNGRMTTVPLHFVFCAPQVTLKSDKLVFNIADISTDGYTAEFELDDTAKYWRRIGFYDGSNTTFTGNMDFSEYGFYRADGTRVDDGDFFFAMPDLNSKKDAIQVEGNASYTYEPGTYYYVYHMKTDWEYNGKTYGRVRADFRYEITLK